MDCVSTQPIKDTGMGCVCTQPIKDTGMGCVCTQPIKDRGMGCACTEEWVACKLMGLCGSNKSQMSEQSLS